METRVSSAGKEVFIGDERPTVLIGERINPAGKKKMADALRAGNLDIVRKETLEQVQAGADIIDVNVSTFGVDEVALLPQAVKAAMDAVDVPLCIDSANPRAIEAALKVYKGKPIVNSVSGEEHSLESILSLVKEYGTAVIALTQDDAGIPRDVARRVAIAQKIVARAEAMGIPREDIIIDCLALALGADAKAGVVAIETVREVKARLGLNITLGASNVSFGLPDRVRLNSSFLAIAITAGVNCPLVDVARVRPIALATDLVLGRDQRARRYIEAYRRQRAS